jgi:hypothetical protein
MVPIGIATAPGVAGPFETCVPISTFGCIHLTGIKIGNSGFVQGQNFVEFFNLHVILLFLF